MNNLAFELSSVYTPYLNVLAEELGKDNTDFVIRCNEHDFGYEYDFWSELLDENENPAILHQQAWQLAQLLNGILSLIYERPLGTLAINNLFKGSQKVYFEKQPASGAFNFKAFLKSKQEKKDKPIADLLQLCKTDENLRDLIFLLGTTPDYIRLYMAYETMGSIMGSLGELDKLVGNELKKMLNIFTKTANNYNAIGVGARHRKTNFSIPEKVIEIKEARDLIREVAHIVIQHKYEIKIPVVKEIKFDADDLFDKFQNAYKKD